MSQQIANSDGILYQASKAEAEGIFRVLISAFHLEKDTPRWKTMQAIANGRTEQFLIMKKNDEIVATLAVFPHWLRIGSTKVFKGDVGEVAVLQKMQGQGIGTQLMKGCINYLRERGFHLSRLGGLNRFYARFGYRPFPRRYYEFLLTEAKAGASVISPENYLTMTPEQGQQVRLYYPHNDWHWRDKLYNHFNENRSGSLVKTLQSAQPPESDLDPDSLNFVYEENGRVTGYLFASEHPEENSPFEAKMRIGDVAFQKDKPEVFKSLMRYALRAAIRRGIQRVTARLPFDPMIQGLLTEAAIPFSLRELQGAPASNMMMVVNLHELIKTISTELSKRRIKYPTCASFSIELEVDKQVAFFTVNPFSIKLENAGQADARISCDTNTFLRWLFGLNGFDEWQAGVNHDLTEDQARIFSALFRREPCASGFWG